MSQKYKYVCALRAHFKPFKKCLNFLLAKVVCGGTNLNLGSVWCFLRFGSSFFGENSRFGKFEVWLG